jgi:hypothetical protein
MLSRPPNSFSYTSNCFTMSQKPLTIAVGPSPAAQPGARILVAVSVLLPEKQQEAEEGDKGDDDDNDDNQYWFCRASVLTAPLVSEGGSWVASVVEGKGVHGAIFDEISIEVCGRYSINIELCYSTASMETIMRHIIYERVDIQENATARRFSELNTPFLKPKILIEKLRRRKAS